MGDRPPSFLYAARHPLRNSLQRRSNIACGSTRVVEPLHRNRRSAIRHTKSAARLYKLDRIGMSPPRTSEGTLSRNSCRRFDILVAGQENWSGRIASSARPTVRSSGHTRRAPAVRSSRRHPPSRSHIPLGRQRAEWRPSIPQSPSGRHRADGETPTDAARPKGRYGRVGMWRGGVRLTMSVAAPFVWRCLSRSAITPFPHPAHRTQQADFPHCALGQDLTPSPTTGRGRAGSDVRARSTRRGARVDSSRACVACPCA